jgi:hypothetical protein
MPTSAPADVRILGRLAGAVLMAFGLGLTALMAFLVERQLTLRGHIERGALIFLAVCGVLSLFCFPVGYRLITQRPNRYRSVLPPWAWLMLAVLFAATASMFFVLGAHSRELTLGGIFSAVFSLMAIVAARRAQRNENPSAL